MMETLDLKVLGYENDDCVNVGGTCYQGVIKTTYDQLVNIFGEPTFTDADPYEKVNAEWTSESKVVEKDEDEDQDQEHDQNQNHDQHQELDRDRERANVKTKIEI